MFVYHGEHKSPDLKVLSCLSLFTVTLSNRLCSSPQQQLDLPFLTSSFDFTQLNPNNLARLILGAWQCTWTVWTSRWWTGNTLWTCPQPDTGPFDFDSNAGATGNLRDQCNICSNPANDDKITSKNKCRGEDQMLKLHHKIHKNLKMSLRKRTQVGAGLFGSFDGLVWFNLCINGYV